MRAANRLLFERLARIDEPAERGELFHDYMDVPFQLHQWQREETPTSRKSLKNNLRFLRGWLFDSNPREGRSSRAGWRAGWASPRPSTAS